jgi:hypothetical protein
MRIARRKSHKFKWAKGSNKIFPHALFERVRKDNTAHRFSCVQRSARIELAFSSRSIFAYRSFRYSDSVSSDSLSALPVQNFLDLRFSCSQFAVESNVFGRYLYFNSIILRRRRSNYSINTWCVHHLTNLESCYRQTRSKVDVLKMEFQLWSRNIGLNTLDSTNSRITLSKIS